MLNFYDSSCCLTNYFFIYWNNMKILQKYQYLFYPTVFFVFLWPYGPDNEAQGFNVIEGSLPVFLFVAIVGTCCLIGLRIHEVRKTKNIR